MRVVYWEGVEKRRRKGTCKKLENTFQDKAVVDKKSTPKDAGDGCGGFAWGWI